MSKKLALWLCLLPGAGAGAGDLAWDRFMAAGNWDMRHEKPADAASWFQRALDQAKSNRAPKIELQLSRYGLARVALAEGRLQQANADFSALLSNKAAWEGQSSAYLLTVVLDGAQTKARLGQNRQAGQMLEEALAGVSEDDLAAQPNCVQALLRLGMLASDEKQWARAKAFDEQALAKSKGLWGGSSPWTLDCLHALEHLRQAQGQLP